MTIMEKLKYIIPLGLIGAFCIYWISLVSPPSLTAGEVTKKHYEPARSYVMMMPMVTSTGKITTTTMIPYVVYDDEDWVITIGGTREDGKYDTRCIYVAEPYFNELQLGDWIELDGHVTTDPELRQRQ